jgi:mannose-6-phosphate isomerase-like protein (cupin superfamily)
VSKLKKYRTKEFNLDTRVCGFFNESPLAITRTHIEKILDTEQLHSHKLSYEYYIFLKGKAKILIENQIFDVLPGDVVLAEPGEKHKLFDIIDAVDYITIKTNNDPLDKTNFDDAYLEQYKEKCKKTELCLIK